VEYSFHIQNTNCDAKYVSFTDILPDSMRWGIESLALGDDNELYNPHIHINSYGGSKTLHIDSLLIPGANTLKFTATAMLLEDAPTDTYDNRAEITYERVLETGNEYPTLLSLDRETLDEYTSFNATWQERLIEVELTVKASPPKYKADGLVEITYTLVNPDAPITDMFLNMDYNDNFTYVANSFTKPPSLTAFCVLPDPETPPIPFLTVAGTSNGESGFTLPTGTTELKVTLKAPALDKLEEELDEFDNPTGKIVDLDVRYDFSTEMDDPCVLLSIIKLEGDKLVPYSNITHIKTNKHITTKIKK
jgi:hypothetical protein